MWCGWRAAGWWWIPWLRSSLSSGVFSPAHREELETSPRQTFPERGKEAGSRESPRERGPNPGTSLSTHHCGDGGHHFVGPDLVAIGARVQEVGHDFLGHGRLVGIQKFLTDVQVAEFLAVIPHRDQKSFLARFSEAGTAPKSWELPGVRSGGLKVSLENLKDLAGAPSHLRW